MPCRRSTPPSGSQRTPRSPRWDAQTRRWDAQTPNWKPRTTLCASAWVLAVGFVTERNRHISITMLELVVGPRVWRVFRLVQMLIAFGAILVLTMALWKPAMKVLSRTEYSGTALNSIQPTIFKVLIVIGCVLYLAQLVSNVIRWIQHTEKDITGGH